MDDDLNDEFKYDNEDSLDDEYEKILDKDIETNCGLNIYVDKLDNLEEISEEKLLDMDKKDIVDYKNKQITKLKAYILSLEREKEDIIENFKNTTNILLEKIKQKEFEDYGVRPETAKIVENIKDRNNRVYTKNYPDIKEDSNVSNGFKKDDSNLSNGLNKDKKIINIMKFEDNSEYKVEKNQYERCANCKKDILKENSIAHSLNCFRNFITCKVCKELISVKLKKEHLLEWRTKERIIEALKKNDSNMFIKCFDHGSNPNLILDLESGNAVIHLVAKYGNLKYLEILLGKDVELDALNKGKESALFLAIRSKNLQMVKALIEVGIDINRKNSEDLTPLMLACSLGSIQIVELLLNNHANLHETNILGDTCLKLAQRFGHEELVLLLIQKYKALIRQPSRK